MADLQTDINAALALSIATLNTLFELKVVTLAQAQQTVEIAIRTVAPAEREKVRAAYKASMPTFVLDQP